MDSLLSPAISIEQTDKPHPQMLVTSQIESLLEAFQSLPSVDRYTFLAQLSTVLARDEATFLKDQIAPRFKIDFLRELPMEVVTIILQELDVRSLLRASAVNKEWYHLIMSHSWLWRWMVNGSIPWKNEWRECLENDRVELIQQSYQYKKSIEKRMKLKMNVDSSYKAIKYSNVLCQMWKKGLGTVKFVPAHQTQVVTCLLATNDKIISGSEDTLICVWDHNGNLLNTLSGHSGGVWALDCDGDVIASGATDRTCRLWSANSGIFIREFIGHSSTVRCLELCKNVLISGSRDSSIRVWDKFTGNCMHTFVGHISSVRCLIAFTMDDEIFTFSGSYDQTCRLWNASTGECKSLFQGHHSKVYSVEVDLKTKRLFSGSLDFTIRVWTFDGDCIFTLVGHRSLIALLKVHNRYLFSGSADGTIRVWDLDTLACKYVLEGHKSAITSFDATGNFLVSGSDGYLKLWNLETGAFVRNIIRDVDVVWRVSCLSNMCVAAVRSGELTRIVICDYRTGNIFTK